MRNDKETGAERNAIEHALRESAEKFRTVFSNAAIGFALVSPDGTLVDANPAFCSMVGFDLNELHGAEINNFIHPDDLSENRKLTADMLAGRSAGFAIENRYIRKSGTPVWVRKSVSLVRDSKKNPQWIIALVLDVTERRKREEQIRHTNALLKLFTQKTSQKTYMEAVVELLQQITGCCCIGIRLRNQQNEIPYVASAGYTQEFLECESGLRLEFDECACTRVLKGEKKPCDKPVMTSMGSFFCSDTRTFLNGLSDQEKLAYRGVCIKSGYASVAVIPVQYRDVVLGVIHIADRKPGVFGEETIGFLEAISPLIGEAGYRFGVEESLLKSVERYHSLVAATAQIVWTTNAQGEVADDLPSWRAFTGQSLEEIRGKGWADALHPEDVQRVTAEWQHAIATHSLYQTEYRIRRADGTYRDFAVRGVPVYESGNIIREWVGACTDITERKKADEQLKALNESLVQRANQLRALTTELTLAEHRERKRMAQFLHDSLQQILVAAKIGIELIGEKPGVDVAIGTDLEKLNVFMVEAIELCRTLAVDLSPPLLSEIGLSAALSALAKRMQNIYGLDVRVTADGEIPADAEGVCLLLCQAVRELLFNVVKHSGVKCAAVQIGRSGEKQVTIKVSDEGIGFDSVALNRVDHASTGLGLFGIQERIMHIGGQMEIESAPGRGTCVTLRARVPSPVKSTAMVGSQTGKSKVPVNE